MKNGRSSAMLSETNEYQANPILDFFDLVAMAIIIGILLFILGPQASWGGTARDLKPPASILTTSELFEKAEQPMRETIGKASTNNVDLEKTVVTRTLPK
jgi:hypothetical protein